tara:strand:- start:1015 stop:2505 length:1491 start_codon:yes stop_codon:yes gene_type:complete
MSSIDASAIPSSQRGQAQRAAASKSAQDSQLSGVLTRGIVREVIYNPLTFDSSSFGEEVRNPSHLQNMSRNTLFVTLVEDGKSQMLVCPPLFPQHLQLPIKVGEHVWLIKENEDIYYWLARIPGNSISEDVNYTHSDRKFLAPTELNAKEKSELGMTGPVIPSFNDSSETDSGKSLKEDETYQSIIENSKSNNFRMEPVPALTKRPGDLVLQGSNNTAIILGEARGWTKSDTSFSTTNAEEEPLDFSGSIDLVAGRARDLPSATTAAMAGSSPNRTAPSVIENELGKQEADKNGQINNIAQNPHEGDPDFYKDASRIYISSKSSPEKEFSLNESFPSPFTGKYDNIEDQAAIVIKSDHIRIVSRKDDEESINGSIRILKEGSAKDDAASIFLEPSGNISIAGNQIYLGRTTSDSGAGGGPGENGAQPYVLYQQLEDLFKAILSDLDAFATTLNTHITPGYGAPSPQILEAAASLKTAIASRKSEIPQLKSTRIFGE